MKCKMLENQKILVTGGTSGIGKSIALKFLEEGAEVAIFGRNASVGAALAEEHPHLFFYQVDVEQSEEVRKGVEQVLKQFGTIDCLVNNAGITRDQLFIKMKENDWDQVMDINIKSCFLVTQALMRTMIKARSGRIINISSVVGLTGNAGQVNYASSKAAIIGFTKALAKEVASRNILVNCIAPGFIETPMTDQLNEKQKEETLAQIPLKRLGTGDEVADVALFLASSLSSYLTGQVIVVDGGMVM